jgi:uncharacterized protein YfaT (DUF1175 family)
LTTTVRNWHKTNLKAPDRPWIYRNCLSSITLSYAKKPEAIQAMCIGLLRNWWFELNIAQKHQAYFIRCLAHPAIQQDSRLQQEVTEICAEILRHHAREPLHIHEGTRVWLENIVERGQFPEWWTEEQNGEPD